MDQHTSNVWHPLERQQLSLLAVTHNQEPALVLRLGKLGRMHLAVRLLKHIRVEGWMYACMFSWLFQMEFMVVLKKKLDCHYYFIVDIIT